MSESRSDRSALELWPHCKLAMSPGAGSLTSFGFVACKQEVIIALNLLLVTNSDTVGAEPRAAPYMEHEVYKL